MLGKTAGGLYWMFRLLERGENTARMVEAGFRMALTRSTDSETEWKSVVTTSGVRAGYDAIHDQYTAKEVIDYLLRDTRNPSSVLSVSKSARDNARLVRTALTTEVWEAVNENWMVLTDLLKDTIQEKDLPAALATIRQHSALVRGALHGTMLRNDIYDFSRLGTFIERADNTARIIDVKYYTLLPSVNFVGSSLDNVQWETVLRSVSAHRSFRWLNQGDMTASAIADFLILDRRLPRSLAFCISQVVDQLDALSDDYKVTLPSNEMARKLDQGMKSRDIGGIFEDGLHEFISTFIGKNNALAMQIETDFRFNK